MRPTLSEAFRRAIMKGRELSPEGLPVTMGRVVRIFSNGMVEVQAGALVAIVPVAGEGLRTLRPGGPVAVGWQRRRPVVAIAHSARRSGAPVPLPEVAGGIVEELFIAGEPGARDVYFRNDQQVTPLQLRAQLPGDPVAVRWGADGRSFVLRVGGPLSAIDFSGQMETPTWDATYHSFEFVDADEGEILREAEPEIRLVADVAPAESASECFAFTGAFASSTFQRHLKTAREDGFIDPPELNGIDPIPQCVPSSFTLAAFADTSILETGEAARQAVTLGELLAQAYGPCAVVDFGLDRARHLLLSVRCRTDVEALIATATSGTVKTPNGDTCGWDESAQPGAEHGVTVRDGEAHAFVVDVTAGQVLFRTTEAEVALKSRLGSATADVVGPGGLSQVLPDGTCNPASCAPTTHPLGDPDVPPPGAYPLADPVEYGPLPAPAITPEEWRDAWDEARFAFVTEGTLQRNGSVVAVAKEAALFIAFSIEGYATPYNPFSASSIHVTWSAPTPSLPPIPRVYHVLDCRILRGPQDAEHPLLLFLAVYRRSAAGEMEHSACVVRADGSIVRVLLDWTPMQTFNKPLSPGDPQPPFAAVPSELDPGEVHDGARVALLGGNFDHVLWEVSTLDERNAGSRTIRLTQLSTGQEIEVGTDWAEFADHDFRILNLNVLYSAKEDDETGKRFIVGWDPDTGAPSLSQAAQGYPIEDDELEPVQALADLEPEIAAPAVRELQAVNDEEALSPTGRTLEPEVE